MEAQLNNRYMSKLEELEQLKEKLTLPSQRTRNLSSDRQSTNPINVPEVKSNRNNDKQSQSVEKFLNLRQQNQNVDNLINTWKQQKTHSVSINQVNIIQETLEHDSPNQKPGTSPLLILEEDEQMQFLEQSPLINIKSTPKVPITTKVGSNTKNNKVQSPIQPYQSLNQNKKQTVRPQTTKTTTTTTTVQKKQVQSMKQSQELNEIPQTPSQKMKQSSLLEKQRQNKMNQAKVPLKPNQNEEKQLIQQILKLKESVFKLYERRFDKQLVHSQNFISKNFEQIVNTIKLDFRFLENDG